MIQMRRNRSGRHVTKRECIESVNVEEESDVEDQEARDHCQTEEARSRQGETEERTQVEDQVEDRTFHHQHGDGSQGTGDSEPCSTRRQSETGRSKRVEDRVNTSAVRL